MTTAAAAAARRLPLVRAQRLLGVRGATTVGVLSLLLLSTLLRTRVLDAGFWIDEGLSVGIASHPWTEIPSVLRQDGAPPLYYLLLHAWMGVVGDSEVQTHVLSLLFALACVPAAFWAGRTLFGRRAAWICTALAAVNPFLTAYAQETRMYTLVALLSLLATGAFVHGFVLRRRRYVVAFAVLLVLLLYTHTWSLFFAFGALVALLVHAREAEDRRRLLADGALAFGAAAIAFLPWLPTLLFQAAHTGAPWSRPPSPGGLLGGPTALLNGNGSAVALLLAAGTGLAGLLRTRNVRQRDAAIAILALTVAALVAAWFASQISPAWANRYLAIVLGPLLLLGSAGLARAGRLGAVALALVLLFWVTYRAGDSKSNVREVAALVEGHVQPGDLVVTTHPEQIAVLHYYLPPGLRYATTLGPVEDPRVMDWRDAMERLERADPVVLEDRLVRSLRPGQRLLLVRPLIRNDGGWQADWTGLVRDRTYAWRDLVRGDQRLREIAEVPIVDYEVFKGIQAVLYERVA